MKTWTRIASAVACAAAVVALASPADARVRKRHAARADVIVVHPRAFTDSGTVVPVGSRNFYVVQSAMYNRQPLQMYSPGILWKPSDPSISYGPGFFNF